MTRCILAMRYLIKHITRYKYSEPIASCQNQVHLAPRNLPHQTCEEFRLWVHPAPTFRDQLQDYYGNRVDRFSIEEPHAGLTITSTSRVALSQPSYADGNDSPAWEQVRDRVAPDRVAPDRVAPDRIAPDRIAGDSISPPDGDACWEVSEFVFDSFHVQRQASFAEYARASFQPHTPIVTAMHDLTARIHRDFRYEARSTTISTPVREVFQRRVGVCQDFAHLQIACLRSLDLPARYVSGYLRTYSSPDKPRLEGADASHAWVGVYCGAAGWLDWDPTNNMQPQLDHITIGWGRDYADVRPIQGVFVGGGKHGMTVSVDVKPIPNR